jgi:hypothetical protein
MQRILSRQGPRPRGSVELDTGGYIPIAYAKFWKNPKLKINTFINKLLAK